MDAVLDDREETIGDLLVGDIASYILRRERSAHMGLGVGWARALHRSVGLVVSTTLRAGPTTRDVLTDDGPVERRTGSLTHTVGVALDIDGGPSLPLGAQLELRNRVDGEGLLEARVGRSTTSRTFLAGHLLYTGRPDLQLSAGLTAFTPTAGARTDRFYAVEALLRYFFAPSGKRTAPEGRRGRGAGDDAAEDPTAPPSPVDAP